MKKSYVIQHVQETAILRFRLVAAALKTRMRHDSQCAHLTQAAADALLMAELNSYNLMLPT